MKKEGSRLVEEENERLRQQILKELSSKIIQSNNMYGMNGCRVKIKWKAAADDDTNGGYNYENLHRFLSKVNKRCFHFYISIARSMTGYRSKIILIQIYI